MLRVTGVRKISSSSAQFEPKYLLEDKAALARDDAKTDVTACRSAATLVELRRLCCAKDDVTDRPYLIGSIG